MCATVDTAMPTAGTRFRIDEIDESLKIIQQCGSTGSPSAL